MKKIRQMTQSVKEKVREYYDLDAQSYIKMYKEGFKEYPANLIRLKIVMKRLKDNGVKTVLDAGCGTCGPLIRFLREGFKATGFDFSEKMIEEGRRELAKSGFDPGAIFHADIEEDEHLPRKKFDAVIALGVFPHLSDEQKALRNIRKWLNKNGSVFIEFRNDLFAAFTLNSYSRDFFLNRVIDLRLFPRTIKKEIATFYSRRMKPHKPANKEKGRISYNQILAKFHNPLTIEECLFAPCGFSVKKIHFYHYHALPPVFEKRYPGLFREASLKMENPGDWRGYLLASAFVVEAVNDD